MSKAIDNLWMETVDEGRNHLNVLKSWLCNSTGGDTSSIHSRILNRWRGRVTSKGYDPVFSGRMSALFDKIMPVESAMKVDDPETERTARELLDLLYELEDEVSEHPELYFRKIPETGLKCGAGDVEDCCMFRNAIGECEKPGPCPYIIDLNDEGDSEGEGGEGQHGDEQGESDNGE